MHERLHAFDSYLLIVRSCPPLRASGLLFVMIHIHIDQEFKTSLVSVSCFCHIFRASASSASSVQEFGHRVKSNGEFSYSTRSPSAAPSQESVTYEYVYVPDTYHYVRNTNTEYGRGHLDNREVDGVSIQIPRHQLQQDSLARSEEIVILKLC